MLFYVAMDLPMGLRLRLLLPVQLKLATTCRMTFVGFVLNVLGEGSGALGTVCIYQASSEDAIRKHAEDANLAVTEIIPIADTVVVRPDP